MIPVRRGLVLALGLAACGRPSGPARVSGEPTLRVALHPATARTVIGGQAATVATNSGAPAFRLAPGEHVTLSAAGALVQVSGAASGAFERVHFASLGSERHVTVDGQPYRGTVEVWAVGGTVRVVNVVRIEEYLLGVVSAEMGRRTAQERTALEAQAIVSRTYALRNAGRFGSDGYDLQAGVTDQVYAGVAREDPEATAAVRATAGRVLTYGGQVITPFFHSTCGGRTASPVEAFRGVSDAPYLRSVSDARGSGAWCDISPRYQWTVTWDAVQLRAILARTIPEVLGVDAAAVREVQGVYVRRQGPSGRALEVRIRVAQGEIPVFGPDIRAVLARPEGGVLGGSLIRVSDTSDGGLVAEGFGWGHGVGMCQWGAIGRARAGQDVRTVLRTYFPGVDVARWY